MVVCVPLECHAGDWTGDKLSLVFIVGNLAQVLHSAVMTLKSCSRGK